MFSQEDHKFLKPRVMNGEVILFLGAGASHGSKNSQGNPVYKAKELENEFREFLSEGDPSLDIGELADDVITKSETDFKKILKDQFLDCTPSDSLQALFHYTWYRCYTLNYDDAILHIPRRSRVQKIEPFSRQSNVEEQRLFSSLQTVFLNGLITHPAEGFILSGRHYRKGIRNPTPWYKKSVEDFINRTFLFLGTKLEEPIFQAHIEEIQDSGSTNFARSFLLVPELPSSRKRTKLEEMGIVPVAASLDDFVNWLRTEVGDKIHPDDVLTNRKLTPPESTEQGKVASNLIEIGTTIWLEKNSLNDSQSMRISQDFYKGMAPTWPLIYNGLYANLSCIEEVKKFTHNSAKNQSGNISLIHGQSGSGKTTATMIALLDLARSRNARVFELSDQDSNTVLAAFRYLSNLEGSKKILYLPNLHQHVNYLRRFQTECEKTGVELIGQIRSSDWYGRVGRYERFIGRVHAIGKLSNPDYSILAKLIRENAVAPRFRKLSEQKQLQQLQRSGKQLLILLLEATGQRAYEEIIESEYNNLPDCDTKTVFCIVALITMSRSRLSVGEIESIVSDFGIRSSFGTILEKLTGMIYVTRSNQLVGRHDIFVRHVIENSADINLIKQAIIVILKSFTIFDVPFVKNAGKTKGNILKFLMRARFLQDLFGKNRDHVFEIYEELELFYQNDGHFWLQRGKYYQLSADHKSALDMFYRSVEAYDNDYARHSLAQQKLIFCLTLQRPTPTVEALMLEGVEELERQIDLKDDTENEYPIVVLSQLHPEVLLNWGRHDSF